MRDSKMRKRHKTLVAAMANFAHPRASSQKWFQDAVATLSNMSGMMLMQNKQAEQLACNVCHVCHSVASRLPDSKRRQGGFGCEECRFARDCLKMVVRDGCFGGVARAIVF